MKRFRELEGLQLESICIRGIVSIDDDAYNIRKCSNLPTYPPTTHTSGNFFDCNVYYITIYSSISLLQYYGVLANPTYRVELVEKCYSCSARQSQDKIVHTPTSFKSYSLQTFRKCVVLSHILSNCTYMPCSDEMHDWDRAKSCTG